jgi:hypothetical protein
MGNHRMEHHRSRVNKVPLIVLETTIIETHKQHARVGVTQSLGASITTTNNGNSCCAQYKCCQKGSINWIYSKNG